MPCSSVRCPDPVTCAALVSLGYLVVHAQPGEVFGLVALPNAKTIGLFGAGWVATFGREAGFDRDEVRAVAVDRGGVAI